MKVIKTVNIFLAIAILILSVNLMKPLSITGSSVADLSDAECYFVNSGVSNDIPIDGCCYEVQKQLECKKTSKDYRCYTSESSERYYVVNANALNYCKVGGYDVKII